jgi:ketosteroid isomerase-like protein
VLDITEVSGILRGPMSQQSVEVVQGLVDAFNRDDIDSVLAAFADDCKIEEPPQMPDSPRTGYAGHQGVREWMGNLREVAGASFELRSSAPWATCWSASSARAGAGGEARCRSGG